MHPVIKRSTVCAVLIDASTSHALIVIRKPAIERDAFAGQIVNRNSIDGILNNPNRNSINGQVFLQDGSQQLANNIGDLVTPSNLLMEFDVETTYLLRYPNVTKRTRVGTMLMGLTTMMTRKVLMKSNRICKKDFVLSVANLQVHQSWNILI